MTRVLLCHNYYKQPGGEDLSFKAEAELLEAHGHHVLTYTVHNDAIDRMSGLSAASKTIWNRRTYRELSELIRREQPEIMHCTNTFPLISPAAYYAASKANVAVVQSLRNYRLLCPNSYFLRDGNICEDCLGKAFPWPAVVHSCYRGSRPATAATAVMLGVHELLGTWARKVDMFYSPSEFTRQKFISAGFPEDKFVAKPNFVDPDPGVGPGSGNYAVYVGRLSPEKDLQTLLDACARLGGRLRLKIVGDGPLAGLVREAQERGNVEWLGHRPLADVLSVIGEASFLIMPSVWYETFGRTIVEAFAKGTPVIVSDLGAMAELVDDGVTGRRFEAGNPDDLATKISLMLEDTEGLARMRIEARRCFEQKYTAGRNYEMLMDIYDKARSRRVGAEHVERQRLA